MGNKYNEFMEMGLTPERYNQMMNSFGDEEAIEYAIFTWGVENVNNGYAIFDFDGTGLLQIEAIGDVNAYESDSEAVKQAVADGIKIIPIEELPDNFDRKYFGWIDTPKNRKNIKHYCNKCNPANIHIARGQMENGEWEQGYYVCVGENHYILTGQIDKASGYPRFCYVKVKPETVCRFTGLYDKNRTKIFTGDIIQYGLSNCVVRYDTKNARYMLYRGSSPRNGFNVDATVSKEVIGNEFDNPEFLKE